MMRWAMCLVAITMAAPLLAQDTVRPVPRPAVPVSEPSVVVAETPDDQMVRPIARGSVQALLSGDTIRPVLRPYLRPDLAHGAHTRPIFRAERGMFAISPFAVARSLRPDLRPASIEAAAEERRVARLRGQVCGDPSIQGTVIGRVNGAGACGIEGAVKLRSVAGVTLSPRATIDCPTARALKTWVERGVLPAVAGEGGGVSSLRVVSHYACRTRNNQPGGRLSEHAFGRAIDIAGIGLRNGTEMTLLTDWNSAEDGAQLRQMWRAACGPFGTVLGPESNRFHRDHFHFDTARYRSGPFCR
ncbi:MAG: extensin family protein [Pseudomonadota bacterium]